MTPKYRRLLMLIFIALCLSVGSVMILKAMKKSILFFVAPTELLANEAIWQDKKFRLGGLVMAGSLEAKENMEVTFRVTDEEKEIDVTYTGVLPDLFREGQGIVAEGRLIGPGLFKATKILAKHDENYMPREVADAIKNTGQWKGKKTESKP